MRPRRRRWIAALAALDTLDTHAKRGDGSPRAAVRLNPP